MPAERRHLRRSWLLCLTGMAALATACGEVASGAGGAGGGATGGAGGGGGEAPEGCPPGSTPSGEGEGCAAAGVGECPAGFSPDDGGCSPILPEAPCPSGRMALPGEATCREVAPCEGGPYGAAPEGPTTIHVDGSFVGGPSDGSLAAPFVTIGEAVEAAQDGGVVAIAAGTYAEDVVIDGKALRLHGRCPDEVAIVGSLGAVQLAHASGSELHDLAVTGAGVGVVASGSTGVRLERVWLHDLGWRGLDVEQPLGETEVTVVGSLIERATEDGAYVAGATLRLEGSVVRETRLDASTGYGLSLSALRDGGVPSSVALVGSMLEGGFGAGALSIESGLTLEGSVISGVATLEHEALSGEGIEITGTAEHPSALVVRGSVIRDVATAGVLGWGSDVELDGVTITDVATFGAEGRGYGAHVQVSEGARGSLTVSRSRIARTENAGVSIGASDAVVVGSVLSGFVGREGSGPLADGGPCTASLAGSVVEGAPRVGVGIIGCAVTLDDVLVHEVATDAAGLFGRGIELQLGAESGPSSLGVRGCELTGLSDLGILVQGSQAIIERTTVRSVAANPDGTFGDGVVVLSPVRDGALVAASASLTDVTVEDVARAGLLVVSAQVALTRARFECAPIPIDGESHLDVAFELDDGGENVCACEGEASVCQAQSAGLAVPDVSVPAL